MLAAQFADPRGGFLGALGHDLEHGDVRARFGQPQRDGPPDPATPGSDEGDLSVQASARIHGSCSSGAAKGAAIFDAVAIRIAQVEDPRAVPCPA